MEKIHPQEVHSLYLIGLEFHHALLWVSKERVLEHKLVLVVERIVELILVERQTMEKIFVKVELAQRKRFLVQVCKPVNYMKLRKYCCNLNPIK